MDTLQYFLKAFPNHVFKAKRDREDLESMPIDSACGDTCKEAIDKAKALDDLIKQGHGRFYTRHAAETQAISQIALELCGLYICG